MQTQPNAGRRRGTGSIRQSVTRCAAFASSAAIRRNDCNLYGRRPGLGFDPLEPLFVFLGSLLGLLLRVRLGILGHDG